MTKKVEKKSQGKKKTQVWDGNVRDAALSILLAVDNQQAYSNLLLNQTIEKNKIDAKDRGLLTELTYGTLQYKMTLDYYLEPYVRGKLDDWVRWLLRLSLYQIAFLTKIPDHAAVNESVEIAKHRARHKGVSSTVNGILRSILRDGIRDTSTIADPAEKLAIETSHPLWLVQRYLNDFGYQKTHDMLFENNLPPIQTVRVNTAKVTTDEALQALWDENYSVQRSENLPECLHIIEGQVVRSQAFKDGLITIQDESSMLPANALDVQPGMRVLDMCAAPGGKTTHIAEKMNNEGELIATDLHKHKIKLIEENSERLGLSIIAAEVLDGRKANDQFDAQSFDRILVDAPCSGLGVIRRKPDIKYTKKESDFASLHTIQLALLDAAHDLLKIGGKMVYSTCTIDKMENSDTVSLFLEKHPDMELAPAPQAPEALVALRTTGTMQVFPQDFSSDGFFVAAFVKKAQ
ncbi:16S rRNA (cytosine(967)-C(5))-methyltransferase RsmB [Kurthia sibirica]|uniref:16S rRNA (cytosine(967)-C(5))-methyltransferase n=1 Tax=Kurthia sibirica TaxID=202750 RepID=A0A2U3AQN9_9BACL|nr:16S rRNA (cytosine(967)-C(5))-methyltransferase RsmB [Kurthia sibirica]PWI26851.1 16S rRNA (cytosine(967)-C(5))-methyltransferase [Kurthia sibirica]GEK32612.1 ribosomal RNA small subunit methyltransferase B [Kurthia sibirica]